MSLLKNLETKANVEGEKDVLGGGGVLDTNVYPMKVKVAYFTTAASGAVAINLQGDVDGKEVRQQFWVLSGNDKGNKNTYTKDGKEYYLPSFLTANSLALLTVGKELSQLDVEKKVIKLYDFEAKEERPTEVDVLVELTGQLIQAGIQKQTVDKNEKGDDGKYYPTGETREINEVVKFFRYDDGLTVPEIEKGVTEAKFKDDWVGKWAGKVINKAKGNKDGAKTGLPSGGAKTGTSSLFKRS
ncbi:single strand DNA binding protein [Salmonella phage vB_SalP_TR2]|uniref:Single-strand DNA binding protein n=1 Tax=Salmonella phage vB_SalP_TR2 TaxID=2812854 RepID=A0A898KAZ8_9CAUD|nr:single strand DNA binding protein [Salmonella phage vB_SalP_TR2]QSJ04068.1 single-strand DNA binding protein [Salmonella phage vB_SalP_TR2]